MFCLDGLGGFLQPALITKSQHPTACLAEISYSIAIVILGNIDHQGRFLPLQKVTKPSKLG